MRFQRSNTPKARSCLSPQSVFDDPVLKSIKSGNPATSSAETPESEAENRKVWQATQLLLSDRISLWELRELALSPGGLVNAGLRRRAWPVLLGLTQTLEEETIPLSDAELELIRRDCHRSVLYRFQQGLGDEMIEQDLMKVLKRTLQRPLSRRQGYKVHYYQGMQDVAGVLLYNLRSIDATSEVLHMILKSKFTDATRHDLSAASTFLRTTLMPLLQQADDSLHDYLMETDVPLDSVILPWILTWFTHDVATEVVASRLIDAFICSHALFPLYLSVVLLMANRNDLVDSDGDPCTISLTLRTFPSKIQTDNDNGGDPTAQALIDSALELMERVPPRQLVPLSTSYHGDNDFDDSIRFASFLKSPPAISLQSFAETHGKLMLLAQPEVSPPETRRAKTATGMPHVMHNAVVKPKQSILSLWELVKRFFLFPKWWRSSS